MNNAITIGFILQQKEKIDLIFSKSLPAKTVYKFYKLANKFNEHIAIFESTKQAVFNQFGEDKESAIKELEKVLSIEVEYEKENLSLEELGNANFTTYEMSILGMIFNITD